MYHYFQKNKISLHYKQSILMELIEDRRQFVYSFLFFEYTIMSSKNVPNVMYAHFYPFHHTNESDMSICKFETHY